MLSPSSPDDAVSTRYPSCSNMTLYISSPVLKSSIQSSVALAEFRTDRVGRMRALRAQNAGFTLVEAIESLAAFGILARYPVPLVRNNAANAVSCLRANL